MRAKYTLGLVAVLVGCGSAPEARQPVVTPAPVATAAEPATSAQTASSAAAAPAASAAPAPAAADAKISLTVTGGVFKPRSAYIVGPASYGRVTLIVSELPPASCDAALKARDAAGALKVRLMYGKGSGVTLDKPRPEQKGNVEGAGAFVELTDKDNKTTQLAGGVTTITAPQAAAGVTASYRLDVRAGSLSIKGQVEAVVCVTQAEVDR